ncbi:MAG: phosphoribosyl 1,2-cyclic phosphodiesterase [bacterium]|jgi:phosphoribosyl 1,2-cyclic phosphodiesterase
MKLTPLASGSKGNCTLLTWHGNNHALIDCGITTKALEKALESQGIEPTQISAIIVTHEHGDHISGVAPLARKYNIATYMTKGTARFADLKKVPVRYFNLQSTFDIDGLTFTPFPVPHDARETCAFTFHITNEPEHKMGYLTDCGHVTPHIEKMLKGVKALAIEANHCRDMLQAGPYPYSLKKRVMGNQGHLSNEQTAALLKTLAPSLKKVHLMHLSEENNCKEKAKRICLAALNMTNIDMVVATQNNPAPPLEYPYK